MGKEIYVSAGSYFPDFSNHFPGNDIFFWYENEDHCGMRFSASSPHVDELNDSQAISARLFSLSLLVNGALRLERGRCIPYPIEFTGCEGLGYSAFPPFEDYPFTADSRDAPMPDGAADPRQRLSSHLLFLSKKDDSLRGLLFLVGLLSRNSSLERILSWNTLYRIKDTVSTLCRECGFALDNYVNTNELERFTAACNNMSVMGIFARHGQTANKPPTRIMTDLDEAEALIVGMASRFIRNYLRVKHA